MQVKNISFNYANSSFTGTNYAAQIRYITIINSIPYVFLFQSGSNSSQFSVLIFKGNKDFFNNPTFTFDTLFGAAYGGNFPFNGSAYGINFFTSGNSVFMIGVDYSQDKV